MTGDVVAPFCPVQAAPGEAWVFHLRFGDLNPEPRKKLAATLRNREAVVFAFLKYAPMLQGIGNAHSQSARKMRVAGSCVRQRVVRCASAARFMSSVLRAWGDGHQGLNGMRDLSVRQPVIAMPALLLDYEQLPVEQFGEMTARGLWSNIGDDRELSGRQGSAIHQGNQHRRAPRIAKEGGNV